MFREATLARSLLNGWHVPPRPTIRLTVLSASTETTAPARPAAPPQGKGAQRPATGFAALVDDNAVVTTDADAAAAPDRDSTVPTPSSNHARTSNEPAKPPSIAVDQTVAAAVETRIAVPVVASLPVEKPAKTAEKPRDESSAAPSPTAVPADAPMAVVVPAPVVNPVAAMVVVAAPVVIPAVPVQPTPAVSTPTTTPPPLAIAVAALATAKAAGASATPDGAAPAEVAVAAPQTAEKLTAADGKKPATVTTETGFNAPPVSATPVPAADTDAPPVPSMSAAGAAAAPQHAAKTAGKPDAEKPAKTVSATDDGAAAPSPQPVIAHEHRAAAPANPVDALAAQPQPVTTATPAHSAINAGSPTAQLTATVATAAPVPLNGLAVELATRAQSGTSRFEIRLDPAELGRIDVRIDIDRDGNVKSHLTVEKPETLAMLRQDSPQLQRALHDAGLKTTDSGLQFSLGDQSQPRQNADGGERQAQRFVIRDDEPATPTIPVRSYGRLAAARSGVDISV